MSLNEQFLINHLLGILKVPKNRANTQMDPLLKITVAYYCGFKGNHLNFGPWHSPFRRLISAFAVRHRRTVLDITV